MISKFECICYAQIALLRIIEKKLDITPYLLYKEMSNLLGL